MSNDRSTRPSVSITIGRTGIGPPGRVQLDSCALYATGRLKGGAVEVTREIVLPAAPEEVWEALTDPDRLAVVRERRRARCAARRARRVPLGRRRDPARDCRRARARERFGFAWTDGDGAESPSRSRWRRQSRGRVSASSRRRRRSRASGPWGSGAGARGRRRAVSDPGRVFAALADPNRRFLVEALAARRRDTTDEARLGAAGDEAGGLEHLAALADAGLVAPSRAGRETPATASRRPHWTRRRPGSSASAAPGTTGWQHWLATSNADREAAGVRAWTCPPRPWPGSDP